MSLVIESDFYDAEPLWATGWPEDASVLRAGDIAVYHSEPGSKHFRPQPLHMVVFIAPNNYVDVNLEKMKLRTRTVQTFDCRAAVFRPVSEVFAKKRAAGLSVLAERAKGRKLTEVEPQPADPRQHSWKFALNCYRFDLDKASPNYIDLPAAEVTPEMMEKYLMANPNFRLRGRIMGTTQG